MVAKDYLGQEITVGRLVMGADSKGAAIIFGEVVSIHGKEESPVIDIKILMNGPTTDQTIITHQGVIKKNLKITKFVKDASHKFNEETKKISLSVKALEIEKRNEAADVEDSEEE